MPVASKQLESLGLVSCPVRHFARRIDRVIRSQCLGSHRPPHMPRTMRQVAAKFRRFIVNTQQLRSKSQTIAAQLEPIAGYAPSGDAGGSVRSATRLPDDSTCRQYLLRRQTREKLQNFRGYKGAQSYPSRRKDGAIVDCRQVPRAWRSSDTVCEFAARLCGRAWLAV